MKYNFIACLSRQVLIEAVDVNVGSSRYSVVVNFLFLKLFYISNFIFFCCFSNLMKFIDTDQHCVFRPLAQIHVIVISTLYQLTCHTCTTTK